MNPKKLERQSLDGCKLNLEALYSIAPSCFTEIQDPKTGETKRVVNFDILRTLLGDDAVEGEHEMYQFTWPGKQKARREAAAETTETLRPIPDDSVDWDTTENIYIEGDNLRVLKLLQKSYLGKIKMIYIDPPYNTGKDFVYHDDFSRSATEENLAAGNIDEEGNRFRVNPDTNGRFHSDWCSMMYSRLLVAHRLLSEDGVIFISIDDNEVHNLRKICDEVFGERNFVSELIWHSSTGGGIRSKHINKSHQVILLYAKSIDTLEMLYAPLSDEAMKQYTGKDQKGIYRDKDFAWKNSSTNTNQVYEIEAPDGEVIIPKTGYIVRYIKERFNKELSLGNVTFKKGRRSPFVKTDGTPANWNIYIRKYLGDGLGAPASVLPRSLVGLNNDGTMEIQTLFGERIFDFPKSTRLMKYLLVVGSSQNSLILDFFSGSGTTAHAVMQLNAEDLKAGKEGKRKYICVQLAETTPKDSEARKAGYTTIPEIAKERIRRAGKKIKEENPEVADTLDTGFRVFELDSSNYEEVSKTPNEYDQAQLDLFLDNIKTDRKDLDLLFGAMLSWGVPLSLSQPLQTQVVDGCTIYNVTDGELVACFAEEVSEAVVRAMATMHPERVLFRDSCFAEDKMKINLFELFKQALDWDEREALDNIRVI